MVLLVLTHTHLAPPGAEPAIAGDACAVSGRRHRHLCRDGSRLGHSAPEAVHLANRGQDYLGLRHAWTLVMAHRSGYHRPSGHAHPGSGAGHRAIQRLAVFLRAGDPHRSCPGVQHAIRSQLEEPRPSRGSGGERHRHRHRGAYRSRQRGPLALRGSSLRGAEEPAPLPVRAGARSATAKAARRLKRWPNDRRNVLDRRAPRELPKKNEIRRSSQRRCLRGAECGASSY